MAIPQLTPFPEPPNASMPEDVFDAAADQSLVAQARVVVEYNGTILPWVADQLAQTQAARDAGILARNAAQASAASAAQSAIDATSNGAYQVNLATVQAAAANDARIAAEAAKNQAQAIAEAVGAAASLPATGYGFLTKDEITGAIGWFPYQPPPFVQTPKNVAPAAGVDSYQIVMTLDPYYSLYGKTQKARRFQMSKTANFAVIIYDTGVLAGAGATAPAVSFNALAADGETIYWRGAYQDSDDVWSAWSQPTTVKARWIPTSVGQAYQGGFYFAQQTIGADTYALITAPKSYEVTNRQWGVSGTLVGATSNSDGTANTALMVSVLGSDPATNLGAYARSLTVGGYNDFFIGAYDQVRLLMLSLLRTLTTIPIAFQVGGSEALSFDASATNTAFYWTSKEHPTGPANTAVAVYYSNASTIFEYQHNKAAQLTNAYCRPMRRVKITQ